MNAEIQTARELATHAADIAHLQGDMDKMAADMAEIKTMIANINSTLAEAKGGWRMLLLMCGISGTVGAGLMQLAHWMNK